MLMYEYGTAAEELTGMVEDEGPIGWNMGALTDRCDETELDGGSPPAICGTVPGNSGEGSFSGTLKCKRRPHSYRFCSQKNFFEEKA